MYFQCNESFQYELCIMLNVYCSKFMNVVSEGFVLLNTLLDIHFNLHCILYVSVFIIV